MSFCPYLQVFIKVFSDKIFTPFLPIELINLSRANSGTFPSVNSPSHLKSKTSHFLFYSTKALVGTFNYYNLYFVVICSRINLPH